VTVDGEPANLLPKTERGAYLVLTSSDYEARVDTIPIAGGLDAGSHVGEIVADRGWDQWPIVGWSVGRGPDPAPYDQALRGLVALAILCLLGVIGWGAGEGRRRHAGAGEAEQAAPRPAEPIQSRGGPAAESRSTSKAIGQVLNGFSAGIVALPTPRLQSGYLVLATILAGVFYVSPWFPLTVACGAVLAVLIILRLDQGLALVALTVPFYLYPRPLLGKAFSMVEIVTLLCLLSWAVRFVAALLKGPLRVPIPSFRSLLAGSKPPSTIDVAVLFLVLTAAVSTFFADYRHVALRELRVVVLEPALLYLMLRTTKLGRKAVWRLVDALVVGAAAVAIIGLVQYVLDVNIITAEQGFRRLRSVYGSPNNAALYLGRVLPIQLVGTLMAAKRRRRIVFGAGMVPVALAVLLTFSRGALLVGLPCTLLVLALLIASTDGATVFPLPGLRVGRMHAGTKGRPGIWMAVGAIALTVVGVIWLLNTPRFAGVLDARSGTLFFRLQLWRASWTMFLDHPWLGVGPDNFLYQYRGRYILPSAWQEPHLSHPHNLLLSYGTRLGLVGLVVFVLLQVGFWGSALQRRGGADRDLRALTFGLMGSMGYTLAHGLVDASTFFVDLAFAFLLTLGLVQWLPGSDAHEQKD
jgi:O-antigen ligase